MQSLRISDLEEDADSGPTDADVLYNKLKRDGNNDRSMPGMASDVSVTKKVASAEQLRAMLRKTPGVPG